VKPPGSPAKCRSCCAASRWGYDDVSKSPRPAGNRSAINNDYAQKEGPARSPAPAGTSFARLHDRDVNAG
jgi:hypothetical protein